MDRYRIDQWIARGGMAVVFRGEDERLHRPVCVKLFFGFDPQQQEFAVVLEHFVQEAFALSRLQHPSTLRIFDFGYLDEEARSEPFFVTEFADSGHLGKLVEGTGGMEPDEVLRLLRPIVGALREAHAADIVHRDLKPSNILLSSAGGELSPKLADFSIAKAYSDDLPNRASETNAQAPLYSLSWAAPEQLSSGRIGPGTDIFALGLVAAFMLTETLVYPGEDVMALYSLRSEGAAHRREAIAGLGLAPPVEAVIQRACEEDPAHRYGTIDELFRALSEAFEQAAAAQRASAEAELAPDEDEDDTPTGEHRVLRRASVSPEPSVTTPIQTTRPTLLPPVSPSEPQLARGSAAKPRLRLSTLDADEALVGTRRIRLVPASNAPLIFATAMGGRPAKLRATPVNVGTCQVHLKGLNCFLRPLEGRPSSGLDVDRPRTLELLDPQSGARGELRVVVGGSADAGHELELRDIVLLLPRALADWAAVLEPADGSAPILLYRS